MAFALRPYQQDLIDRPPQTPAEMIRWVRMMVDAMPREGEVPPEEGLFGEPYGDIGMRRDVALEMGRLAHMAAAFSKRLEGQNESPNRLP